ncbi:AAA family ATPase [Leptolyngbya sp. AN02str]|uniref:AAA family ATPase n=1 Tax=Leptolyngbya sp. AN02str TaxID=3423363 RepID=UPI003D3235FC
MYISKLQIYNYKSFYESEEVEFTPGFNIIVGQNNAGKTALVEALSLKFDNKPHRSFKTAPREESNLTSKSRVSITLGFGPKEALQILINHFSLKQKQEISFTTIADGSAEIKTAKAYLLLREVLESGGNLVCNFRDQKFINPVPYFQEYGLMLGNTAEMAIQLNELGNDLKYVGSRCLDNHQNHGFILANFAQERIYTFRAERLNVGTCQLGRCTELMRDASNLPEVLSQLQSNPARYREFIKNVQSVFPSIATITTPSIGSDKVQIKVWSHDPNDERPDLAVSLEESGTGIGQVLAMLYVVTTSKHPQAIVIDEPQSFLHPGAIKKLFEVLKKYSQHQFIITTHSPTALSVIRPSVLLLVRKDGFESHIDTLKTAEAAQVQDFLSEVGASFSDVFGADNILWVEGPTEVQCFTFIVEEILNESLKGTKILSVLQTGDFDGKHAKTVAQIYERLSGGGGLLPPAIGFIFDREGRSLKEREEIIKMSKGKFSFLQRKMYENYLLHPEAIAALLNQEDSSRETPVSAQEVNEFLEEHSQEAGLWKDKKRFDHLSQEWLENIDGAELLQLLFGSLTDFRVSYKDNKVRYGLILTEWLIQNKPSDLQEIADLLKSKLFPETA